MLVAKNVLEHTPDGIEDAFRGVFDGDGQRWVLLQLGRGKDHGGESGQLRCGGVIGPLLGGGRGV